MRALANNTARQAIDTHHRRGQVRNTRGKLFLAGIALAISIILLRFSAGTGLTLWTAIGSLLVSIYWGGRYFLLRRKLRSQGRTEKKKPDAPPAKSPRAPRRKKPKRDAT
jgi:hypothetical protein